MNTTLVVNSYKSKQSHTRLVPFTLSADLVRACEHGAVMSSELVPVAVIVVGHQQHEVHVPTSSHPPVTIPFRSVPSIYFESDHSLAILKRTTCQVHLCRPTRCVSVSCIRFRNATSVYAVKIRYFYELHRRIISRYSLNLPQKDLGLNNKTLGDEVTASTLIAWYSNRTLVFDRRNFRPALDPAADG